MAPTTLYELERRTGVARKVIAEYVERGWVPDPATGDPDEIEIHVKAVRALREVLTPREVDAVLGSRRGTGMTSKKVLLCSAPLGLPVSATARQMVDRAHTLGAENAALRDQIERLGARPVTVPPVTDEDARYLQEAVKAGLAPVSVVPLSKELREFDERYQGRSGVKAEATGASDELAARVAEIQEEYLRTRGKPISQAEAAKIVYKQDPAMFGRVMAERRARGGK